MTNKGKKEKNQGKGTFVLSEQKVTASGVTISKDELVEAMVEAHFRIQEEVKKRKERETKEWKKQVGYVDSKSKDQKGKLACHWNNFKVSLKILWKPQKHMKDNMGYTTFLSAILIIVAMLLKVFFYLVAGFFVLLFAALSYDIFYTRTFIVDFPHILILLCAIVSPFVFWGVGRIFLMAEIESSRVQDRETVTMLFSAVFALIAVVITVAPFIASLYTNQ